MFVKQAILTISICAVFLGGISIAAVPAAFVVEVDPPTFAVNQSVDVTIKAVDKNGNIVKDYTNMVMIEFDEVLQEDMYELPADGLYTFTKEDQGIKKFSKGLKIKEEGKYTLKVRDLQDENIMGKQSIIVWNGWWWSDTTKKGIIDIIAPMSWETITTQTINLMGKSDMTNATIQIYINKQQIEQEAQTDANGNFNVYIKDGVVSGKNAMFVRVINVNGNILAESSEITFFYTPVTYDDIFKWLTITPNNTIKAWEEVTFTVLASPQVRNVELRVGNANVFVLDKEQGTNNYKKNAIITTKGQLPISVTLILQGWDRKTYQNVDILTVGDGWDWSDSNKETTWWTTTLSNIKITRDNLSAQQATLSRESSEDVPQYEIRYGTSPDNLTQVQKTSDTTYTITWLDPNADYYFQIIPTDEAGNPLGDASSVISAKLHGSANWSCTVGNINFTTTRVWNQYYLVRNPVQWATTYTIYRSEFPTDSVANMQKVWTTTTTRYPYPFDPTSPVDKYARYAVQADCVHGAATTIDNVKKVKVWPKENILVLIIASIVIYGSYRRWIQRRY